MSVALTVATAVACGLMGGIFFAFSSFIMPALGHVPPAEGIRAMQRINVDVFHWSFMGAFFGTGVLCIVQAVVHLTGANPSDGIYGATGAAMYIFGCLLVTAAGNVPLNNNLAAANPDSSKAGELWRGYALPWTRWNHLRTLACLGASAAFAASLAM